MFVWQEKILKNDNSCIVKIKMGPNLTNLSYAAELATVSSNSLNTVPKYFFGVSKL